MDNYYSDEEVDSRQLPGERIIPHRPLLAQHQQQRERHYMVPPPDSFRATEQQYQQPVIDPRIDYRYRSSRRNLEEGVHYTAPHTNNLPYLPPPPPPPNHLYHDPQLRSNPPFQTIDEQARYGSANPRPGYYENYRQKEYIPQIEFSHSRPVQDPRMGDPYRQPINSRGYRDSRIIERRGQEHDWGSSRIDPYRNNNGNNFEQPIVDPRFYQPKGDIQPHPPFDRIEHQRQPIIRNHHEPTYNPPYPKKYYPVSESAQTDAEAIPVLRKAEKTEAQSALVQPQDLVLDPEIPIMKFTNFPIFLAPSFRNVFSGYSQVEGLGANDLLNTMQNLPYVETEEGEEFEVDLSRNCIIFHPGSRNLRLGLAGDPFPKEVPHIIARKLRESAQPPSSSQNLSAQDEEKMIAAISWGESQLLERLQAARRKPANNAHQQVANFNASTKPTPLLEHNDPFRGEWTSLKDSPKVLIGEKVVKLSSNNAQQYSIRYPLLHGCLNTRDYSSLFEIRGDLEELWSRIIQEELGIGLDLFESYSIGLVVPDQFCPVYVSQAIDILLKSLGFYSIFLIQESVSATFGAGISTACVVNIGAQATTVSCVEEGRCIPTSCVALPYGGDDITELLIQLLQRSSFPYHSIDLKLPAGWRLAEELKRQLANMNETELSVHLSHFFVPIPDQPTLKYEIKVYDEGFIAPMLYFNPQIMDLGLKEKQRLLIKSAPWVKGHVLEWLEHLLDRPSQNNPYVVKKPTRPLSAHPPTPGQNGSTPLSLAASVDEEDLDEEEEATRIFPDAGRTGNAEFGGHALTDTVLGIDGAITHSIRSTIGDEGGSRRWYSNILVTGGGAGLIPGFVDVLSSNLRSSAPAGTNIEVLSSVRDLDPRVLPWKGAAVFAKLEITQELHINFKEWEMRGLHAVQDKLLFMWPSSN